MHAMSKVSRSNSVVPGRAGALALVECKAVRTVTPAMASPMQRLVDTIRKKRRPRTPLQMFLVHESSRGAIRTRAVAPGVQAVPWRDFMPSLR